jgi:hypothetical protein
MQLIHASFLFLLILSFESHSTTQKNNFLPIHPTHRNSKQRLSRYYIDGLNGKDSGDGSIKNPFANLESINRLKLLPGDCIYLAGNQTFEGSLQISHFIGTAENQLTISSYGKGCAIINSKTKSALTIDSCTHVSVSNIVVKGNGRLKGNEGTGIEVKNSSYIQIDRVETAGFLWNGVGTFGGHDLRLTRIYAHENGFAGIEVSGAGGQKEVRNIYIGQCIAENNPGNPRIKNNHSGSGIIVSHSTQVLIENCEAFQNGWDMPRPGNGPVGIWAYESDSLTIAYCYSHDNKTSVNGKDGGGFDFDGGVTNSVMKKNLSMNNEGAGYGLFQYGGASEWKNNMIVNNVSINDGKKNSQAGFFIWCDRSGEPLPLNNCTISKNIIVNSNGYSVFFESGLVENMIFAGNYFLLLGNSTEHIKGDYSSNGVLFKGNTFWAEKAEKLGKSQPEVMNDRQAIYQKRTVNLPEKIQLSDIKEIVDSLFK